MSKFQQEKITHYAKNQKNLNLNKKRQSTDGNTEITEISESSDRIVKQLS